jgi:hypothetical protein
MKKKRFFLAASDSPILKSISRNMGSNSTYSNTSFLHSTNFKDSGRSFAREHTLQNKDAFDREAFLNAKYLTAQEKIKKRVTLALPGSRLKDVVYILRNERELLHSNPDCKHKNNNVILFIARFLLGKQ